MRTYHGQMRPLRAMLWLIATGLLMTLVPGQALAQTANDAYFPTVNGNIRAIVPQPDGSLVIGGAFTEVNGVARGRIARLLPDGSLDPNFTTNIPNGHVYDMAVDNSGRILVVGDFTQVGASQRNRIARLLADGTLDNSFNPDANGLVLAVLVQPDDRIVIGGSFSNVAGTPDLGNLARLHPTGALDTSFVGSANSAVWALARQPDGRLLVGGSFGMLNGQPRVALGRLHRDGGLDSSFSPNVNGTVFAVAPDPDGRVWIGGNFDTVDGQSRPRLARLTSTGGLDSQTYGPIDGNVWSLAVRGDGALAAVGSFTVFAGFGCAVPLIRNDEVFNCLWYSASASSPLHAVAEQPDGKLVAGATQLPTSGRGLMRFGREGIQHDHHATPEPNGPIYTMALDPRGRVLVGGEFTRFGCCTDRRNFTRIGANSFGMPDSSFALPDPDDFVLGIGLQADSKILIAGRFNTVHGVVRPHIARLLDNGNLDFSFQPALNAGAWAVVETANGQILVGGEFTQVNGSPRAHLVRLNADGSLDPSFAPTIDGLVFRIALQADGRMLISGMFSTVNGQARPRVARLNTNGSLDSSFNPDIPPDTLGGFGLDADGRILLGTVGSTGLRRYLPNGALDPSFQGSGISGASLFVVQPDGRIVIGGGFQTVHGQQRLRLARLHPDGSLDASFAADLVSGGNPLLNAFSSALVALPDGRLWVGGTFDSVGGVSRKNLARLKLREGASEQLIVEDQTVRWLRGGTGQQLALPPELEFSSDGGAYFSIGKMMWVNGEWRLDGFQPPPNQAFYLRVSGPIDNGPGAGRLRGNVRKFFIRPDRIFTDRFEQ
ncbi:MAG: hypothetical protein LAT56_08215 [Wenzhouxiangella sp.]|nr:hypothetical protein [Wenzhouxiangella sp.]